MILKYYKVCNKINAEYPFTYFPGNTGILVESYDLTIIPV